jgi:hypothetical protein
LSAASYPVSYTHTHHLIANMEPVIDEAIFNEITTSDDTLLNSSVIET